MKKYLLSIAMMILASSTFVSCINDDNNQEREIEVVTTTAGVFVLNEGNYYNNVNGSLSYLDYGSLNVTDGLFKYYNNRNLGGTPNSIASTGGYMFIATTDDNVVEALDYNLKSVAQIRIPQPRSLAVDSQYVYVSSYDGCVYKVSASKKTIEAKSEVIGEHLEGIAVRGDNVYVCNSCKADWSAYFTNVVKLDVKNLQKVADVEVPINPYYLKASKDNLYVLSKGNYADVPAVLSCIDKNDRVSNVCEASYFDVVNDVVVAINSVTDWTTTPYKTTNEYFVVKDGKKTAFTPNAKIPAPCSIALDPHTGYILVGSYNLDDKGNTDYSAKGTIFLLAGTAANAQSLSREVGVGPTNFFFNETQYLIYK